MHPRLAALAVVMLSWSVLGVLLVRTALSLATGSMPAPRGGHTATLLRTGKDAPWKVNRLTPPSA